MAKKQNNDLNKAKTLEVIKNDWLLYVMLIPGLLYYALFHYKPMTGLVLAFKHYSPMNYNLWDNEWAGFYYFEQFFNAPEFWRLFQNTLILGLYNVIFFFPLPIILSLMLNEVKNNQYKKLVQSVTYMPHFLSWVVIGGITYTLFTTEGGAVAELLNSFRAFIGLGSINILASEKAFRPIIVGQQIWKDIGWGTIVFLSAMTSIDQELYEAAAIDGSNRWKNIFKITLPQIAPTIAILLVLRMGNFLNTGFDQIYVMVNGGNRMVGEVFDTFVYETGIMQGKFSYTTAVGMFKSVIGLIMVTTSNWVVKKLGQDGIM